MYSHGAIRRWKQYLNPVCMPVMYGLRKLYQNIHYPNHSFLLTHLIQEIKTTKNPSFCWPQFLKQKQQQKVARLAVQLIPPHSETKTFKKLQLKWPGGVKLDTPLSALVTLTAQVMCFHITIHCCYWNNLRARKISGEVPTAYNEYPRDVNS